MPRRRATTRTAAVLLMMAGCAEAPPEVGALPDVDPPAASGAEPDEGAPPPHIEFASLIHDFGVMPEIETRTGRFAFTNMGGRTLVINEVKASCGCTVPSLEKRRFAPGERGEILVEFEPAGSGDQLKRLSVFSNSEPEAIARLTITADVTPFVDLQPPMLTVDDLVYGQAQELTLTASCLDESFVIESLDTTNKHVTARVVEPGEGSTRTILLTIAPTAPWGGFFSWLEVTSRARPAPGEDPVTHTRRIRVQGQVSGALTARPHTFRFGVRPGQTFERRVKVWRPSGEPFVLQGVALEVTNLDGPEVRVEPAGPGAYELVLTAKATARPGPSRGQVTFTTDVAGEEELAIPISGVVRSQSRGVR